MFEAQSQTFEEPESGVALTARLSASREERARRKLTGFVIPRADQQQNEYVAPSEERLAWLTGFTGSAGMAVVLTQQAAVFVDGRYTLQAAKQVDHKAWSIEPLADPPPESWLAKHLIAGDRLGFDPWLHTSAAAERLAAACAKAGAELVAVDTNPLDSIWTQRPPPPMPRIRRARVPRRWCRRTPAPPYSPITASCRPAPATISKRPPMSRSPTRWRRNSPPWRKAAHRSRSTVPPPPTR